MFLFRREPMFDLQRPMRAGSHFALAAAGGILLLGGLPARADEPLLLKPAATEPHHAYIELEAELDQKMTGPDGNPMNMKSRSIYGVMQKTTPRDGGWLIELTFDRMLGYMVFNETMQSLYDSDDPGYVDASPMHRDAFDVVLNTQLKITLDANGLATSIEGADAIRQKLKALGDQNFVSKTLLEGDFTDRQLMSQFGDLPMILLPNKQVNIGEKWEKVHRDEYPQVGKVIVKYGCSLTSIETLSLEVLGLPAVRREVATVNFEGSVTNDEEEKAPEGKRLGKINGSFKGRAHFDPKDRRFVQIQRDTQATIEVPPWWTPDPEAPLFKIESSMKQRYTVNSAAEREKRRREIARLVAEAAKRKAAEEAAAMAGPVDPVTPANEPVPWLQWGGPDRNFSSSATGLANRWPEGGPPRLWEHELGDGFSAILCDGDTLYTMYSVRDKEDAFKGDEIVVALDARTGKTRWEHRYAAPWPKGMQMEFGPGPHSTPIVVGDKIYTVGCTAKLNCLDKNTGSPVWSRDLHEEYQAELLERGYGASPLSYENKIWLTVSKEKGKAVMAFDPADGKTLWQGGDFQPGYASLLAIAVDGVEQLIAFSGKAVLGLDPSDGRAMWSVDHPTQWGANITTPLWSAQDKHLFVSSAYGMGSRGIRLEKAGSQIVAKELWFNPKMKIQHGDAVRVGDHIYGSSGDFGPSFLDCIDVKTGEFAWRQRLDARANVLHADGKLLVLDENGGLFLVKADPEKYRLLAKAPSVLDKTSWTTPTLVGRTLYLRDRRKIMALNLGPQEARTVSQP